nr:unnamed protein product [Callosobruchus chinensis]
MSEASILEPSEKFLVAGIISTKEFQKSRYVVKKLHACFPKIYEMPEVRSMLNVEWTAYLTKIRRNFGKDTWKLKKCVAVFLNGEYLGDDEALLKHISKKFRFSLNMDWYNIGKCQIFEYLQSIISKLRQLAYMTVAINNRVIGTMLFELYSDLVPLASENFLQKCKCQIGGYTGTPIQRIMPGSWIQCGGWKLPEHHIRCENYVIPHDKRGVLCMCNKKRHKNNTTQFYITLAAAPWMDYRYVAFGRLIQGEEILAAIESVPTNYESPKVPIDIVTAGEITFDPTPDYVTTDDYLAFQDNTILLDSLIGPKYLGSPSQRSVFSMTKLMKGFYGAPFDIAHYSRIGLIEDYLGTLMLDAETEEYVPRPIIQPAEEETSTSSASEYNPCSCSSLDSFVRLADYPNASDITI